MDDIETKDTAPETTAETAPLAPVTPEAEAAAAPVPVEEQRADDPIDPVSEQPATGALDPMGKQLTGETPEPEATDPAPLVVAEEQPNPAPVVAEAEDAAPAEQLQDEEADTGTDLAAGHVTPLPDNGPIAPIVLDTAEHGAGEILLPERPEWPYADMAPILAGPVHYRAANSAERPDGNEFHAAVITKVNADWTVNLTVFCDGRNPLFVQNVAFGDDYDVENVGEGQWAWPKRV